MNFVSKFTLTIFATFLKINELILDTPFRQTFLILKIDLILFRECFLRVLFNSNFQTNIQLRNCFENKGDIYCVIAYSYNLVKSKYLYIFTISYLLFSNIQFE